MTGATIVSRAKQGVTRDRAQVAKYAVAIGRTPSRLTIFAALALTCTIFVGCYRQPDRATQSILQARLSQERAASKLVAAPDVGTSPFPPDWVTVYRKGVGFMEQGRYEQSIVALTEASRLAPRFSLAYVNRGFVYRKLGRYEEALDDLRKGLELDQFGSYMTLLYVAEILAACPDHRLRNAHEAIEIATQGCERTQWTHGPMLAVLAAAYAEKGDFEQAVRWQTKAADHVKDWVAGEMAERLELYKAAKPCRKLLDDPRGLNREESSASHEP